MVVNASLDDSLNSRGFSTEDLLLVMEVLKDLRMYFHGVRKMLGSNNKICHLRVAQTRV